MAVAIAASGLVADAHHSISGMYDSGRQVTIDGTVAQFQLVNPHPFLVIDVQRSEAIAQQWRAEMDNRSELVAVGVTAATFRPGDRIVVTGSAARNQSASLYVRRLDRAADGFWYEQVGQSPRIGVK
jgi:uncharacterized protein DUF6152